MLYSKYLYICGCKFEIHSKLWLCEFCIRYYAVYPQLQLHTKFFLIKHYIIMIWYSRKTIPNCINWYLTIGGNKYTLCSRKCWTAGNHKAYITCEIPCLTIHTLNFDLVIGNIFELRSIHLSVINIWCDL